MAKTIRNEFDKALSYENLMKAHLQSRKGKGYRKGIILFNLKQEEYIMWLYDELKNLKYKHGGYTVFYITEPKLRRIEKSKYIKEAKRYLAGHVGYMKIANVKNLEEKLFF